MWNLREIVGVAAALRLFLVCFGRIQDALLDVKFTDIDYRVFVDAAEHVIASGSPYDRATYRYTPLFAWFLTPAVSFPEFGKILFNFFDLINAWLVYKLSSTRVGSDASKIAVSLALYNPLTLIVSSRGNAESMVAFNVLLILYFLQNDEYFLAALFHGLAIHVKLFPIIYLPSVFFWFLSKKRSSKADLNLVKDILCNFQGFRYVFVAISSFFALTCFFYFIYGFEFLQNSLLFHFSRSDIKHNFSPYFYVLYLFENSPALKWISLTAFVPQALAILVFGWKYREHLTFAWFLTTFAFVSFNKVCTSQYFVWYLTFLPLIIVMSKFKAEDIVKMVAAWFGAQGLWLFFAYLLEFRGFNTFFFIWICSLLFLGVNCWLIVSFARYYLPLSIKMKKL